MKIADYYSQSIIHGYKGLTLVIEYLVNERKVLAMEDSGEKLSFYLQDKYQVKMNEYLKEYLNKDRAM